MTTNPPNLVDQIDAAHVLGVLSPETPGARKPGSFTESLIHTALRADGYNSARLATAYPSLMQAISLYRNNDNGISVLTALAKGSKLELEPCAPQHKSHEEDSL